MEVTSKLILGRSEFLGDLGQMFADSGISFFQKGKDLEPHPIPGEFKRTISLICPKRKPVVFKVIENLFSTKGQQRSNDQDFPSHLA